jgi:hypothetical protein
MLSTLRQIDHVETSVLIRATRNNIPEDAILHTDQFVGGDSEIDETVQGQLLGNGRFIICIIFIEAYRLV